MASEITTWGLPDIERAARYVVQSGLFGVKSPERAIALMLLSQAEGLHPMQAVREYHIIDGRPALRADAMLARFQLAGGRVEWHVYTDAACEATFSHPAGGMVKVRWTIEDAKRAGLAGRDAWRQYPRQMLRSRVISEGVRTVYPAVVVGLYTPEEIVDVSVAPTPVSTAQLDDQTQPITEDEALAVLDTSSPAEPEPITPAQLKKLATVLSRAKDQAPQGVDLNDRDTRLRLVSWLVGREINSSKDLTKDEASTVIDALERADVPEMLQAFMEVADV